MLLSIANLLLVGREPYARKPGLERPPPEHRPPTLPLSHLQLHPDIAMKPHLTFSPSAFAIATLLLFLLLAVPQAHAGGSNQCVAQHVLGKFFDQEKIQHFYYLVQEAEASLDEANIRQLEQGLQAAVPQEHTLHLYFSARIFDLQGQRLAFVEKKDNEAEAAFEKALKQARAAAEAEPDFADAKRLTGSLYGQLLMYKPSVIFGPVYGIRSDKQLAAALELDPQNPDTQIALGVNYLFTPGLFGGSNEKAVEAFQSALAACPQYYAAHLWLGEAYRQMDEPEKAIEEFKLTLQLAPESSMAKDRLAQMSVKTAETAN